nr:nucleotidyltransferase domain-containing protein [uncultured Methanobrevibacter sp.]
MKSQIIEKLKKIESQNNVTILYACESGSRAWGFDNAESDYDVRFIYKSNNLKDYVSLSSKKDVIEVMEGDLDIVGWDLKKALLLHYRGNPNLREWIISPIKYIDWKIDIFKSLPDFDDAILKYHYTSIASNNWKLLSLNDLEITKKVIKMYLYNCRCILAWLLLDMGINPPINIFEMLKHVDDDIKNDICYLIKYYKNCCIENLNLEVISRINKWMGENLEIMRKDFPKTNKNHDFEAYDEKFFEILSEDFENYI